MIQVSSISSYTVAAHFSIFLLALVQQDDIARGFVFADDECRAVAPPGHTSDPRARRKLQHAVSDRIIRVDKLGFLSGIFPRNCKPHYRKVSDGSGFRHTSAIRL